MRIFILSLHFSLFVLFIIPMNKAYAPSSTVPEPLVERAKQIKAEFDQLPQAQKNYISAYAELRSLIRELFESTNTETIKEYIRARMALAKARVAWIAEGATIHDVIGKEVTFKSIEKAERTVLEHTEANGTGAVKRALSEGSLAFELYAIYQDGALLRIVDLSGLSPEHQRIYEEARSKYMNRYDKLVELVLKEPKASEYFEVITDEKIDRLNSRSHIVFKSLSTVGHYFTSRCAARNSSRTH